MENNQSDETIKEILKEDQLENGVRKKKKGCLARIIFLIVLLVIAFFGFMLIQQYLLNLEAQAIVNSMQTATALANDSNGKEVSTAEESQPVDQAEIVIVPQMETPTPDPLAVRTATVAAQLTSVAEFQLTATDTP